MSINSSPLRCGNFTSSNIHKLMTLNKAKTDFGTLGLTYIHEKNIERKMGIWLNKETNAKETSWGLLMEDRVFNMDDIGLHYTMTTTETDYHKTIPNWSGSKDGTKEIKERAVFDFKAPFTRKSFAELVMPIYCGLTGIEAMKAIRDGFEHDGIKWPANNFGDKYYWQLVSNAELNNCNYAELIVYMPYQSELLEIFESAKGNPTCKWMNYISENEIPYLPDGGHFKNLNIISFEVPKEDKELLRETVIKANERLCKPNTK